MITISFANNKGGSGKSTSCSNLAAALSYLGRRVLLIDGDMQMNLTLSFFGEDEVLGFAAEEENLCTALAAGEDLRHRIRSTADPNIDIIASTYAMSGIESGLTALREPGKALERGLRGIKREAAYDYVLIDAPPTLGLWVKNILAASDRVIIPAEASPWGLFGLANLLDFIENSGTASARPELLGVLVTKVDERKNYYRQTMETLKGLETLPVFRTVIHVDSAVEWAQDNSTTVVSYRRSSRSAREYLDFAKEVEEKCR